MNLRYYNLFFVLIYMEIYSTFGAKEVNVALRKNATQLGTYWGPERAVEGCTLNNDPDNQLCCSASDGGDPMGTNNFWQVDLQDEYSVGLIIVYGRTAPKGAEQLGNFIMYGLPEGNSDKILLYNNTGVEYGDGIFRIDVNPEKNISVVRIERPTKNEIITLCEVQVYEACDDGFYGTNCTSDCGSCMNNLPCDKVTGTCSSGCAAGWEGLECKQRENIALNASTSQSSTAADWSSDRAVDGCTNRSAEAPCSSKTQPSMENFLTITLDKRYTVGRIVVIGPEDEEELSGFEVYFGSFLKQLLYSNVGKPYGDGIFTIYVQPPLDISTITINRNNETANVSLIVCEVEVYEVCPSGFYGELCDQTCGNCLDDEICYGNTGRCPRGCAAGWNGDTCHIACNPGTFGENCNTNCGSCLNNQTCNIVNGSCPTGCDAGYHGDACDMECGNGTYGFECNETCGYCFNDTHCDVTSGNCSSCAAGYQGTMCKLECEHAAFGPDCLHVCNCFNNETCDRVSGMCSNGCAPGWDGMTCSTECLNNTYGLQCSSDCGKCKNNETCDAISGKCASGCAVGWLNENCNVSCSFGYFGENCTQMCGHCLNNETCDIETGVCTSGCKAGWQGDDCKTECRNGTFGEKCAGNCFCAGKEACNKETGICPSGCEIGFSGEFCEFDTNRAIGKSATQSTTFSDAGDDFTADLAVDGNFEQSWPARTCSATEPSPADNSPPYWYVDMDNVTRIDSVVVYGKEEISTELEGFLLYLSNSTNISGLEPTYNNTGVLYDDGIFNISLGNGILAQFVYITLEDVRTLSLCEVRVFGECPDGTFGTQCEDTCYCADGNPCNKTSGLCPDGGCIPGWIGEQCNETCQQGFYGDACSGICGACANNLTCDHVTGICDNGCSDGWLGVMCNKSCESGYYGKECNSTCGNCKSNAACDHVTGECIGCAAGFHGSLCVTGCTNFTHGEDCAQKCGNCVNNTICDVITGNCDSGCADGYVEPFCTKVSAQVGGNTDSDSNVGAIVGGVIGGVAAVILIGVAYKLCSKRGKLSRTEKAMAYYPSMRSGEAASATNNGFSSMEGSVNYYNFDSSTKL